MSLDYATRPTFADIAAARERLKGQAVRTPAITAPALDRLTGGRVFVKPECLQRTGSFKFRGAWNFVSQLPETARRGGVVAYSSGNHAQGVAAAAALRGFPAVIVMPADAPGIKIRNTRALGAEVVTYDRASEDRIAIGSRIAAERDAVLVPPYEHRWIIAGQGTAGAELADDVAAAGARLDAMLVCTGGGGLTAGVATALAELSPATRVYSVEPDGFDDHARSLAAGQRLANPPGGRSICDALLATEPGELTFSINRELLAGGLAVSDAEVRRAMRFAFEVLKLVAEPGGAVALAAVLAGRIDCRGRCIGLTLSGGNAEAADYAHILAEDQAAVGG